MTESVKKWDKEELEQQNVYTLTRFGILNLYLRQKKTKKKYKRAGVVEMVSA